MIVLHNQNVYCQKCQLVNCTVQQNWNNNERLASRKGRIRWLAEADTSMVASYPDIHSHITVSLQIKSLLKSLNTNKSYAILSRCKIIQMQLQKRVLPHSQSLRAALRAKPHAWWCLSNSSQL